LIIGWDAADWELIRGLTAKGRLPHLQKLIQAGVQADLATLTPCLSPLLWTSIATGKTADKHGILSFLEPDLERQDLRLASSTSRQTKALWNLCHQSGLRSLAVSWYASHPAEPVRGAVVSNLLSEAQPEQAGSPWALPPGVVHPEALAPRVAAARVHPDQVPARALGRLVPRWGELGRQHPQIRTLARHLAQCLSVHQAALELLRAEPQWDLAMVFHEAIDSLGHQFMQFFPPRMKHVSRQDFERFSKVMPGIYELLDELLGELLRAAGPDTTTLLLSDHGFHSDHRRPVTADLPAETRAALEASWHREHGVLVLHGPGIRAGATVQTPNLLDVTPTALALLGLPMGRDMDGRVLAEALSGPAPPTMASWEDLPGEDGRHPADRRQDPFDAQDALRQLVDLGYLAPLPEDARARLDLARRETRFNLACVQVSRGRQGLAAELFQALVNECPAEPRYVAQLARSLLALGRVEEAAQVLVKFLEASPADREANQVRLLVLIAAERLEEAAPLAATLAAHPDASELARSDLAAMVGNWPASAAHARAWLKATPGDAAGLLALARAELMLGQFETAAERCLDRLETQPDDPEAHHLLGTSLAWLGDHDHAIQSFEAALARQPGRVEAHQFLAALQRQLGRPEAACRCDERLEEILRTLAPEPAQRRLALRPSARGPAAWLASLSAAPSP
jgi:tetratricopeptide (TPR) repeat protein